MRQLFVDTSAYFALTDKRDENHEAAVHFIHQLIREDGELFTTNYIVAETHTLLLNRIGNAIALQVVEQLYKSQTRIYRVREAEERRALEIIRTYTDSGYEQSVKITEVYRDAKGQISMISFTRGDQRFNYRIVGIAIYDGKVLLQKPAEEGFWFLPGGRAEFQETSEETLRREMREELHTDITIERLLWVVENFFQHGGRAFHELGFYFLMSFPKDSPMLNTGQTFIVREIIHETTYEFIFQWHPLDSLKDIPLHPLFLQTALQKLPDTTEHIVHKN